MGTSQFQETVWLKQIPLFTAIMAIVMETSHMFIYNYIYLQIKGKKETFSVNISVFQCELPYMYDKVENKLTQLEENVRFYGFPIDKAFEVARMAQCVAAFRPSQTRGR